MREPPFPFEKNKKLEKLVSQILKDKEFLTLLKISNINAIDRLGFNDHGPVHVRIVALLALKILRILMKKGIEPSVVKNYQLEKDDAEVIVVLAAFFHDIGHVIHRKGHELLSTILALPFLEKFLPKVYQTPKKEILKFEILHAIYSHEPKLKPLTLEGGILKVADALDMEEGRARIPYQIGSINIHSLSAMAIKKVIVKEGEKKPLKIIIKMRNPAGIFQVDELLREKIQSSGLEKYLEIEAILIEKNKEKIIKSF